MPTSEPALPETSGRTDQIALPVSISEADFSPPRGNPFPIVGIGASAGGLEAFGKLLGALPANTGMAFVLVQHLDPTHESLLTEILRGSTKMPVLTASEGAKVEPNHVYVITPNSTMVLRDGHLGLAPREAGLHLPIDIFFLSLARVQGGRAVGVVLSGNASDGSLGLQAIKAECGITFAQTEASAHFSGMPRSAIATGSVDFILPPEGIARELGELASHPYVLPGQSGKAETETLPEGEPEFRRILAALNTAVKVDFSHYKPATIRRRIGRRMIVLRIDNLADYSRYAIEHSGELGELYRDLLISVTSFFRDPGTFEALKLQLSAALTERKEDEQAVRAWAPGCATGEEVYSLAICIHELLEEKGLRIPIQLFGSDISEMALERARQGIFSETIKDDVSPERLRRFFIKMESGYQISKAVRESCIFARHDVTRDAPFSNLDLLSCRNLLIYLDQTLQRRVFPVFHYALNPTGLLMLGSAETATEAPDLFLALDKQHRIYSRKSTPVRLPIEVRAPSSPDQGTSKNAVQVQTSPRELEAKIDRVIQNKYSPDAVLVDSDMRIVQFRGHTSPYLDPSPGEASLNLLRMARESLVVPLRRAIQAASERNVSVQEKNVVVDDGTGNREIVLDVTPLMGKGPGERFYLVVFAPMETARVNPEDQSPSEPITNDEQVLRLDRELLEAREYLHNLSEDYEAHSEELQAANEEIRSANEELQSANEELGTTKEELQSTNEELTTVNEEMQTRNRELSSANSDFKNLLGSVSLAILMVDSDLRVRRFNPAAERLLHLGPLDIGRPIGHIRGSLEAPDIEKQVQQVIETLHESEQEVQDVHGRWHSVIVRPYRTLENHVSGGVITIQDIDPLKRSFEVAKEARDFAEAMIETVREPLIVLDADLRVQRATAAFFETFLVSREETEGRYLYDLGNGQWNVPRLRELLGAALFRNESFYDFEVQHDFPHIGRRMMRLNARRIPRQDRKSRMLLLSVEDVTERREKAEIQFKRLFEAAKDGMVVVDAETEAVLDVNPFLLQLTNFSREQIVGKPFVEAGPFAPMPAVRNLVAVSKEKDVVRCDDVELARYGDGHVSVDITANRYQVGSQQQVQLNIRDITSRKQAARELSESEGRFRLFVESVRDYALFQLDVTGMIVTWTTGAERLLGWSEAEVIGKDTSIVFVPEDIASGAPKFELETARMHGRAEDERWHIRKDGSRFFASGVLTQVRDEDGQLRSFAKIMRDITERQEQEEQLRDSLEQKSVLVREIHHRVKNNLQVIVSLLSLQSNQINNPELLAAFEETESRVRAIAQIHERLYASEDLTEVEFGAYLTHLSQELCGLYATEPDRVVLNLEVQEMVLHIEQAIPLGLIANELIINSLKHGLQRGPGKLDVTLSYVPDNIHREEGQVLDDGWARVQVVDSGPGLPDGVGIAGSKSMGFRLVNLLVKQLRGEIKLGEGPGANMIVTFPLK